MTITFLGLKVYSNEPTVDHATNAKNALAAVLPELLKLKVELESIRSLQPLDGIVKFFAEVSVWHDRGLDDLISAFDLVNAYDYDQVVELLCVLKQHFINAGRNQYGTNRTSAGEPVTADNVYLGNIYGLFTHTVRTWQNEANAPKGGWGFSGMGHLNPYDVVSAQAKQFMDTHAPICDIIGELETYSKTGAIK